MWGRGPALYEQNYYYKLCLTLVINGPNSKNFSILFIKTRKKTISRYCPFNAVAFISTGNSVPAITDFQSWCLLHTVLNY